MPNVDQMYAFHLSTDFRLPMHLCLPAHIAELWLTVSRSFFQSFSSSSIPYIAIQINLLEMPSAPPHSTSETSHSIHAAPRAPASPSHDPRHRLRNRPAPPPKLTQPCPPRSQRGTPPRARKQVHIPSRCPSRRPLGLLAWPASRRHRDTTLQIPGRAHSEPRCPRPCQARHKLFGRRMAASVRCQLLVCGCDGAGRAAGAEEE